MRANVTRLKTVFPCVALALALAACTTTTTLTTSGASQSGRVAARGDAARRQTSSSQYLVQRGDTLYSIAFRNRVDLRELIAWNDLTQPYTIYPGQRLRIERSGPVAPDSAAVVQVPADSSAARPFEPRPVAVVQVPAEANADQPSEPMRVARGRVEEPPARVGAAPVASSAMDASGIAARRTPVNGDPYAAQRVAESSRVPSGPARAADSAPPPPVASMPAIPIAEDDGVRAAMVDGSASVSARPDAAAPVPLSPVAIRTVLEPAALPQTPAEPERDVGPIRASPMRIAGGIGWRWPTSATLVGRYSADDEARQGIRLQGPAGTPVTAAADGEVVYSGNGLVGLGELVIIKHGPEYLSAYGLNRKRLVTEGQKVKAGQLVAEMGNSAGVAGLLHFEVRRSGRPIDPLTVLPPR